MSIQAMAWAFKQRQIQSPTHRYVLLCLANYAGEDGCNAFPSVKRLCDDSGLAERTVREALDGLVAGGLIERGNQAIAAAHITRADHRPVVYDLIGPRGAPAAPRKADGVHQAPNGVQVAPSRGAPAAPDPKEIRKKTSEDVVDVLRKREEPPRGRKEDFEAEYAARFGVRPL